MLRVIVTIFVMRLYNIKLFALFRRADMSPFTIAPFCITEVLNFFFLPDLIMCPLCLSPVTANHTYTLCQWNCFWRIHSANSSSICHFVCGLFHFTWWFTVPYMFPVQGWIFYCVYVHLIDTHLHWFSTSAIANTGAINLGVKKSVWHSFSC